MFNYKKAAYITTGIATIGCALLLATPVFASTNKSHMSLSQDLATKYHLNESSVKSTIKQYYKTHHFKRVSITKRLSHAVKKGLINQSQATSILNEREILSQKLVGLKSLTPTQRKATIKSIHSEAKTWATANKVPVRLLLMR